MAHQETLTDQQVSILRWVASGCPDGVVAGDSHRISAAALRRRGLLTTSGRGPTWTAQITRAGHEYLARVDGPTPPVPRQANAVRHTPADGSVTVAAESNGGSVEIEVADTGDGIPQEEHERVFEPFFRHGGGARARDGSGLGLSICRAIVEVHGGRIWLADSARGTRVRFTLPRAG